MSAVVQRETLAVPPTAESTSPPAPEHPLQFAAARLVAPLVRRFHSSWGPLAWLVLDHGLIALWPDTGAFLFLWSGEAGRIRAEWLLVDPTGTATPRHGSGALDQAAAALTAFRTAAPVTSEACPEERFWELVEATDLRLELLAGRIYAMAGADLPHEAVVASIVASLKAALGSRGCLVFASTVFTQSGEADRHLPDVVVVCGRPERTGVGGGLDPLINPTILVEVESPTSRHRDNRVKPEAYRRIASLETYLVVDHQGRSVTVWPRRDGHWAPEPCASGTIRLHGVDVDIAAFFDQMDLL